MATDREFFYELEALPERLFGLMSNVIVLTNDDGVEAPGFAALRVSTLGMGEIQVMAPLGPRSGCSHRVTTHKPIAIQERGERVVAVDGSPADCVRLALYRLDRKISWVLSGINEGGNLGADLYISGTVAAVREAAIHGIPSIALSQYRARGRAIDWDQSARWTTIVLLDLMARPHEPGTFWNVNLPHPEPGGPDPEVVHCQVDPSPLPLSYREDADGLVYCGDYQRRARLPGRDVDICFGGRIAVSKVQAIVSVGPPC